MRFGVMRPGVMRKIGIAVLTLAMIVSMAAAFAACGVSSDKSDSEAGARIDYTDKLTQIIALNDIREVTIVRMEVPCCGGLQRAAENALKASGKFIPWQVVTISRDGRVLD